MLNFSEKDEQVRGFAQGHSANNQSCQGASWGSADSFTPGDIVHWYQKVIVQKLIQQVIKYGHGYILWFDLNIVTEWYTAVLCCLLSSKEYGKWGSGVSLWLMYFWESN